MDNDAAHQAVSASARDIYAVIAAKIRTDSQTLVKPIPVELLSEVFPELKPEEIVEQLVKMTRIEQYGDVRVHITASGAAYLYSENSIATDEAVERIVAEETQNRIVDLIRYDSKKRIRLTAVTSLCEKFPDLEPARVQQYAGAILNGSKHQDIHRVAGPSGVEYLYSIDFMTETYAHLLARVEAKDPEALIAETVREESRIYPRPTRVGLFYAPVFQLQEYQMETVVESVLARDDCKDIKKIVAPNGALYLYSDRYLNQALAERYVQWEEVEKFKNQ